MEGNEKSLVEKIYEELGELSMQLQSEESLNGRVKSIILTKLEETQLWVTKL